MSKIATPSVLRDFLESYGLKAKKRSSQNFLIDGNIIRKIVAAAQVSSSDVVIEIGPGPGALTQALLETGAVVIAIEKDQALAKALHRLQTEDHRLHIYEADALEIDLAPIVKNLLPHNAKAKIVANLPYHITTPLIARFVPMFDQIETVTVMVQKEVAERFVAQKGSKNYSSFTVFLEHYCTAKYCFTVEPTCFYPRPSVKSAIAQFSLKKPPSLEKEELFFQMTRGAFNQRRKMIKSSLKDLYDPSKVQSCLTMIGLCPQARPEDLSWKEFIALHQALIS